MQRNVSIFDIPSTVSPVMAKEETNGLRVVCKCTSGAFGNDSKHML